MTKLVKHTHLPNIFDNFFGKNELLQPFDSLIDQVFNETFPTFTKDVGNNFFQQGSYPKCNVVDHPDKIMIEAAIPGMAKEDVDIEILNEHLTISGIKQQDQSNNDVEPTRYIRRELKKSAFRRSFKLGDNLRADKISASFDNGILHVEIPKKEPVKVEIEKPKHVKIK